MKESIKSIRETPETLDFVVAKARMWADITAAVASDPVTAALADQGRLIRDRLAMDTKERFGFDPLEQYCSTGLKISTSRSPLHLFTRKFTIPFIISMLNAAQYCDERELVIEADMFRHYAVSWSEKLIDSYKEAEAGDATEISGDSAS